MPRAPIRRSGLRALKRDEDISGATPGLERGGPLSIHVRRVVANRQRVTVEGIDPFPRLPLQRAFRVREIDGRRLRARVDSDGSGVERPAVSRLDPEPVVSKGKPISDDVSGGLHVPPVSPPRPLAGPSGLPRPAEQQQQRARFRGTTIPSPKSASAYGAILYSTAREGVL